MEKNMKNNLKGKVAIITGGNCGIGLAIAKRFLEKEMKVFSISRSKVDNLDPIVCFQSDVNDTERVSEILKEIYEKEKHIDIFVNNAGFGTAGAIENSSKDNIYKLIETNLSAVIALSSVVLPYLKESKGKIINISSVGGIIPLPYQATYSASKAGVEIFSKALANEVKPFGVSVTAILPGDTKTSFTKNRIVENDTTDKNFKAKIEESIKKVEKDEQTGKSPDSVAKVVTKIAKMKKPPLRKTVGFSYKLVVFLPRILSTKMVNFIVRKLYCK